jgi:two-component sensor histidine kinase
MSEDVLADALLIVEEFVANVVDHARTGFDITVARGDEVLRLSVRDHSDRPAVVRDFDPTAARGRGLQLVTAVADSWGCEWHPNGKTVWASLAA